MYTTEMTPRKSGYALEAERLAAHRAERMGTVPNQPKTPHKSFRIDEDLYEKVKAKAAREDEAVTDVVIRAFEAYVAED